MSDPRYDVLIRGGNVIDGTGAKQRQADVAIAGGRIAAVGNVDGDARRVIDAAGLAVAPGFIDVHSHDDVALLNNPTLDFKAAQGVTTVVCGNCGLGAAPANEQFEQFYARGTEGILGPVREFTWRSQQEFYDTVRAAGAAPNAAFLAGHNTIRIATMGPGMMGGFGGFGAGAAGAPEGVDADPAPPLDPRKGIVIEPEE